jgi:hypothetical protein
VVASIRLAIIFAGVFVVVSVVALTVRGQWLTRVGPVQVSEPVSEMGAEMQRLKGSLDRVDETMDSMRKTVWESSDLLNRKYRDAEEKR